MNHSPDSSSNPSSDLPSNDDISIASRPSAGLAELWQKEDWWAIWIGGLILFGSFWVVWSARPDDWNEKLQALQSQQAHIDTVRERPGHSPEELAEAKKEWASLRKSMIDNPASDWVTKLKTWEDSPLEAFGVSGEKTLIGAGVLSRVVGVAVISMLLFGIGATVMGVSFWRFAVAFGGVFALATVSYLLASNKLIKSVNLEYPMWALLVGLLITNTIGTPKWLKPGVRTEFYIKTGLVLLGAKILLGKLLSLGLPGIGVSWVVTPIVLCTTYWFGQQVLRISSRSLNMTISADMSVCGVSAAIATAAACRAKKEELSVAIGLSLMFTAVMMFVMPLVIKAMGLSPALGGAWLGGTIDATGAVAAAGVFLGPEAESVAITVKMIQNILIGVISFGVALYWVTYVDPTTDGQRPNGWEIWRRFPKFVLGFVAASVIFSILAGQLAGGSVLIDSMIKNSTDVFRGWFFCLAFVCIGLDTNFRQLSEHFQGGRPLILYAVGQSFNLLLTLLMAYLMFEVIFPAAASQL